MKTRNLKNLVLALAAILFIGNLTAQKIDESNVNVQVEPLLGSIAWNQNNNRNNPNGRLYNDFCPGEGNGTYVGCVAVAMGQIMKFHYQNSSIRGTGSHSYTHSTYGELSANFGNTTYNFAMMPNELSESSSAAEKSAVAQFLYHVGVSVEMDYGLIDSNWASIAETAYPNNDDGRRLDARTALKRNWGFSEGDQRIVKDDMSENEYIELLKNSLDQGLPIIYAGDSAGEYYSHAFVCDGYGFYNGTTVFHFNYGYGSNLNVNGWYSLDNLCAVYGNWRSNNTDNQFAVINIKPKSTSIIDFAKTEESYKVYPNPTQGMVRIETERDAKLQLFNTAGQLLMKTVGNQIDLSGYPNGLYFLKVDGISTVKIIKQ